MLHELWDDPESEGRYTFCHSGPRGDEARLLLSRSARLVWTVEASSHFEAMSSYYEHQGWGKYTTDQEWDHISYAELGWEFEGRPIRSDRPEALTRSLRTSPDHRFARLREALRGQGVRVDQTLLAEFFRDGQAEEFGVVVTPERRVLTFVMPSDEHDRAITWRDISADWQVSAYRRCVMNALTLFDGDDE